MQLSDTQFQEVVLTVNQRVMQSLFEAKRTNNLECYLDSIDMVDILELFRVNDNVITFDKKGKILIIGETRIKKVHIQGIFSELMIDKGRLEFYSDYNDIKSIEFSKKYQYKTDYCLILFGPVAHKTASTNGYGSTISAVKDNDGYPPVIELTDGHQLKITKTNIKIAIEQALADGTIEANSFD